MYSLPNLLTISRIVVIPVIFLSMYIHSAFWAMLAAVLFIVAAITDYFDGYFARARNETSAFGRLLDPIADKLLVSSALVVILVNNMVSPISYIPVVVILCREILVSGLREFLAEVRVGMPVTRLAKWKTAFQMTALSMILVGYCFHTLGVILLWVAGVLTFITGYQYFQKSLDYIRGTEKSAKKAVSAQKKAETKVSEKKTVEKKASAKKVAVRKKTAAKTKKAAKKTVKNPAK